MTATAIRKVARRNLDALPPEKLKVAADFLVYLASSASDEATAELLRIPGFLASLGQSRRDQAAGKGRDWRKVRRDV